MTEKLLTFVLQGRNDNYMDDYLYRIQISLEMLANSLDRAGQLDRAEILFVDWGSDIPLADVVRPSPLAARILEFIHVPAERATRALPSGDLYTTLMVNIGVRRAAGRYVMLTDTDILWSPTSIEQLFRLLDGRLATPFPVEDTYFAVKRFQMPWDLTQRQPSAAEWERYLSLSAFGFSHEAPEAIALGGFAGAQLMHRDLWHGLRGYDEGLKQAALWADNDLVFRASQRHPWMDTGGLGIVAYHIEHRSTLLPATPRNPAKVNAMTYGGSYAVNGEDWGLGGEDFPHLRARPRDTPMPPRQGLTGTRANWQALNAGFRDEAVRPLRDRIGLSVTDDDQVIVERLVAWLRRTFGEASVANESQHGDLAVVLAAFGRLEHPCRLHHFGRLDGLVLWVLCNSCPEAEFYLESPWPTGELDDQPMHPGLFSALLSMSRFRGYTRIVTQAAAGMLGHLEKNGAGRVEMAVIDAPSVGPHLNAIIAAVEDRLDPGGIMVVLGERQSPVPPSCRTDMIDILTPSGLCLRLRKGTPS